MFQKIKCFIADFKRGYIQGKTWGKTQKKFEAWLQPFRKLDEEQQYTELDKMYMTIGPWLGFRIAARCRIAYPNNIPKIKELTYCFLKQRIDEFPIEGRRQYLERVEDALKLMLKMDTVINF